MDEIGFLTVICEDRDLKQIAHVISQNGIENFADRPFGNIHILHLTHTEKTVVRVGSALIGLRNSLPIRIEIIDKDGII